MAANGGGWLIEGRLAGSALAGCVLGDIEEHNQSCLIVRDNNGQALAYVYFEGGPRPRTAWRVW